MLGCREGDSVWGQGESAASLVGPACARDWERGGSRGPALPGLRTGGLWAPCHPQRAAGPGVQRAGGESRAQQERVGGGAHPVSSLWGKGRRVAAWVWKGR